MNRLLKQIMIMIFFFGLIVACAGCNGSDAGGSSGGSVITEETTGNSAGETASGSDAIITETDETKTNDENTGSDVSADDPSAENGEIGLPYAIVDTGQTISYNNNSAIASSPAEGDDFFGQDAHYTGNVPSYTENGDGTVTDNNTGLMWQQDPGEKMTCDEAVSGAAAFTLAGYSDWRLPTIRELYSLIRFSGLDPSGLEDADTSGLIPFIDDDVFNFKYGDPSAGERIIDSQWATSTKYVSTTMNGDDTMFGVNFADGRIKGYPTGPMPGQTEGKKFYAVYVRGNSKYGMNDFEDNGNGTISDNATGLMWMQQDSGYFAAGNDNDGALTWEQALEWAESLEYAGYDDWRLPNAKELQSIVDYTRSPATTHSAAIDPLFSTSVIIDEGGDADYPFYWTSTTHANMHNGANAVYVAFGEALGWMQSPVGDYTLMDVHGAGAQRSDPKIGNPADYPYGHGPQGDVIRIYNYVRCVRDADINIDQPKPGPTETAEVFGGYMLLAPLQSCATYLIDTDKSIVHTWTGSHTPGNSAYLLKDGTLLRTGRLPNGSRFAETGGAGGIIEKMDWDSHVTLDFQYAGDESCLHHDVEELVPDINTDGSYPLSTGQAFGPSSQNWIYMAPIPATFYGRNISGAQRLPNGNTLICAGPEGCIFEVTPDGNVVWGYQNTDSKPVFRAYKYAYDYQGLRQL